MPSHLRWSTKTDSSKMLKIGLHDGGASLPFNLGCRTDAMIVAGGSTISEEGSVVATVELKKVVVKQSLRQTKATFICASLKSQLPVISCVTTLRLGGGVLPYGNPFGPNVFPMISLFRISLGKSSGFPYDLPIVCCLVSLRFPFHVYNR